MSIILCFWLYQKYQVATNIYMVDSCQGLLFRRLLIRINKLKDFFCCSVVRFRLHFFLLKPVQQAVEHTKTLFTTVLKLNSTQIE